MLNENTHQKLISMKLFGMAKAFVQAFEARSPDGLSFDERFGLMVDQEYHDRLERRLKRRLTMAKLRQEACLEDVDYRHPRGLDRSVIERLATCQWVHNHDNILLCGPTGLGKSWLACALANKACREGYGARYYRVSRLLHDLGIAHADGSYLKELKKIAKVDVLILDDWGLNPLRDEERRDLLEVVEDRVGRRSTVVTSQLPVKKWHDHIGDPTIADSLLDRLVHNSHRIELQGQSMRKILSDKPQNQE